MFFVSCGPWILESRNEIQESIAERRVPVANANSDEQLFYSVKVQPSQTSKNHDERSKLMPTSFSVSKVS